MKLLENIAVISDTHGLLRPEAIPYLQKADLILHVGDVGTPEVLDQIQQIGPTKVIRGNVDRGEWAEKIPLTEAIEANGKWIYMIHILQDLDLDPKQAGMDMVLFGHSHKPEIIQQENITYFNPGSAGKRRFSLPISMGTLTWTGQDWQPNWFNLVS